MRRRRERTDAELRSFGIFMALALVIFSGLFIYRHSGVGLFSLSLLSLAAIFGVLGMSRPWSLRSVEAKWMAFGERISVVMTFVIMFIIFWLVLTPIAIVRRLVTGDIIGKKPDPLASSYWVNCDKDGAAKRFYNPY